MSRRIDREIMELSVKIAARNNLENDYPTLENDIISSLEKQTTALTSSYIADRLVPNIIGRELYYAEITALSDILDSMAKNNLILKNKIVNPQSLFYPKTCEKYNIQTLSVYYNKNTINPLKDYIVPPECY
jgi:hypothetical protein